MSGAKSIDEINAWLENNLPSWTLENNHLVRTYKTSNWQLTLLLANTIGFIAEAAWHHPELHLSYPELKVFLQTHDANGITDNDFELAKKIEDTAIWFPKNQSLQGTPNKWVK